MPQRTLQQLRRERRRQERKREPCVPRGSVAAVAPEASGRSLRQFPALQGSDGATVRCPPASSAGSTCSPWSGAASRPRSHERRAGQDRARGLPAAEAQRSRHLGRRWQLPERRWRLMHVAKRSGLRGQTGELAEPAEPAPRLPLPAWAGPAAFSASVSCSWRRKSGWSSRASCRSRLRDGDLHPMR